MKQLIERVWRYSQINLYGFTLNIQTLEPVKFGISVAYIETQNSFGFESLENVIKHSLQHDRTVGGWYNEENGLFYFDSIKVFRNNEINEAIRFAIENKQIAIFDLTNLKEIKIQGV